jgi:hypothetical protein
VRSLGATCSHYGACSRKGWSSRNPSVAPGITRCFDLHTSEVGAPPLNPIARYEVQRRDDCMIVEAKQFNGTRRIRLSVAAAAQRGDQVQPSQEGPLLLLSCCCDADSKKHARIDTRDALNLSARALATGIDVHAAVISCAVGRDASLASVSHETNTFANCYRSNRYHNPTLFACRLSQSFLRSLRSSWTTVRAVE